MRRPAKFLLGGGAAALLTLGCLWLILLSPYGYEAPAWLEPVDEAADHPVFVYGTLRFAAVRWVVLGRRVAVDPAVLPDHRVRRLDIEAAPGERVEGVTFEVDADGLRRLDRYERLGVRYERVPRQLRDGREAWVYRRMVIDER